MSRVVITIEDTAETGLAMQILIDGDPLPAGVKRISPELAERSQAVRFLSLILKTLRGLFAGFRAVNPPTN
ncbi:MAG: hypothetical protein E1N59_2857 [Puniceicoccaceae bacterium 5H]|nr:MAG: hypothetical protein E1N59_2857 [Puniceicoccaceae bacterium 5H]